MATRHKDLQIPEGTSPDQAFVQILDPATGTGTFLVEIIDIIHKTMAAKWKAQGHGEKKIASLWNEYVPKHLLSRLHAYSTSLGKYLITVRIEFGAACPRPQIDASAIVPDSSSSSPRFHFCASISCSAFAGPTRQGVH